MYQQQLEKKQAEMAPWAEKISGVMSAIQVAESEWNLLNSKVQASKTSIMEEEERLDSLKSKFKEKVRLLFF